MKLLLRPRKLLDAPGPQKFLGVSIPIGLAALAACLFATRDSGPAMAAAALATAAVVLAVSHARRSAAQRDEVLRAEQRATALEQARRIASASGSRLLSAARHEIRTPLSGVLGMAELLLGTNLDAEQRELVRALDSSGRNLLRISDEIVDFARLEIGEMTLRSVPVDLWAEFFEAGEVLAAVASKRGIELVVRTDPTGPRYFLGDPDRLRQIFELLARDSLRSARRGPVLLTLSCRGRAADTAPLRFTVESDGGTADFLAQDRDAGDSRFPAAPPAGAHQPLGFDLAGRLATRLAADLTTEHHSGRVMHRLDFELPIDPDRVTRLQAGDLAELRILVADGSQLAGRVVCEQLEALGAATSLACSREAALSELKSALDAGTPFQAALVAADLPRAGGDALASEIRRDRAFDLLTLFRLGVAGGAESDPAARIAAGFSAELSKPLRIDRLRDLLGSVSQKRVF